MFQFSLNPSDMKKVHFIGIGGVSMSGIAELLHDKGYQVTGSDVRDNKYVKHLESVGIPVTIGQSAENIKDQELFVYGCHPPHQSGIAGGHRYQKALRHARPIFRRSDAEFSSVHCRFRLSRKIHHYFHDFRYSDSHG